MHQYKVLIIEDEKAISRLMQVTLERHEFTVAICESGEVGLQTFTTFQPDVVILDIHLPGLNGYEVCARLRDINQEVAIIMVTAKGLDNDKIMGLELGADDYMVKPFNPFELMARIRANLRKLNTQVKKDLPLFSHRIQERLVYKLDKALDLTPREYELLTLFIKQPNTTFNRHDLLDEVWGIDYVGDSKTVDVHIRRLREKIEDTPSSPKYLLTVWGYGYRWNGEHT